MSQNAAPSRIERPAGLSGRPRTVALIVAATFFMQMLDSTVITTSLPQIARSFGVEPAALGIGVTIYMLSMAVFMPISGWLADRWGSRTVFMAAIVLFVLSSLWVASSGSLGEFVLARAVQGMGGAFMTPVGRILVLKSAKKSQLLQAITLISWPALCAPVLGPVIGGAITTYLSWRWNFFINIPLGLTALALVWIFLPDHREPERRRLDLKGFVLTASASGALLYGLEAAAHDSQAPLVWMALIGGGGLLGAMAVRHLRRAADPLIDLSAFAHETFRFSNISAGLFQRCAIAGSPFLLPIFFQLVFGLSALEAGGYLLVYFLGNLSMKLVTTPIVRGLGFRTVLVGNGVLCTAFLASFALIDIGMSPLLIAFLLFGAGLTRSMQFTALNTLGFADVTPAQRSAASTLSSILQQVSMVLGVAIAAALLSAGQQMRGGAGVELADFRLAFAVTAAISAIGAARFLLLPRTAGDEVAGRAA